MAPVLEELMLLDLLLELTAMLLTEEASELLLGVGDGVPPPQAASAEVMSKGAAQRLQVVSGFVFFIRFTKGVAL
jgi:hypothetical protein